MQNARNASHVKLRFKLRRKIKFSPTQCASHVDARHVISRSGTDARRSAGQAGAEFSRGASAFQRAKLSVGAHVDLVNSSSATRLPQPRQACDTLRKNCVESLQKACNLS